MEALGRARPHLAQTQSEITPCSRPPTLWARRFGDCAQSHPATPASSPAPTRSLLALAGFSGRVLEAAPCLFSARRVVSMGCSPSPASDAQVRPFCPLSAEDATETAGGQLPPARQPSQASLRERVGAAVYKAQVRWGGPTFPKAHAHWLNPPDTQPWAGILLTLTATPQNPGKFGVFEGSGAGAPQRVPEGRGACGGYLRRLTPQPSPRAPVSGFTEMKTSQE